MPLWLKSTISTSLSPLNWFLFSSVMRFPCKSSVFSFLNGWKLSMGGAVRRPFGRKSRRSRPLISLPKNASFGSSLTACPSILSTVRLPRICNWVISERQESVSLTLKAAAGNSFRLELSKWSSLRVWFTPRKVCSSMVSIGVSSISRIRTWSLYRRLPKSLAAIHPLTIDRILAGNLPMFPLYIVSLSMGILKVAKLLRATLMLARLVLLQLT
jgi:hypothetical protein